MCVCIYMQHSGETLDHSPSGSWETRSCHIISASYWHVVDRELRVRYLPGRNSGNVSALVHSLSKHPARSTVLFFPRMCARWSVTQVAPTILAVMNHF
jgi:hypothetical protein